MTPLANVMTVEMSASSNVAYGGQMHVGPAFGQIGGVIGVGTAGIGIALINIYDAPGAARIDIYNGPVNVATAYLTALPLYVPPTPTPIPYTIREVSDGSIQKGQSRKFGPLSVRLYQGTTPVAGVAVHVACGSPAVTCAFPPTGAGTTDLTSGPNGDLLLSYVVVSTPSTSVSVLFSNSNLKSTLLTLGGGPR
jgi:hypothetical protein